MAKEADPLWHILGEMVSERYWLKRNEFLFTVGDPCHAIYAIQAGSMKSIHALKEKTYKVSGFHFAGDFIGLDGFYNTGYTYSLQALENTHVCSVPLQQFNEHTSPSIQMQFHLMKVMSKQLLAHQNFSVSLCRKAANARFAACLIDLHARCGSAEVPEQKLNLTMSRKDISNYLGLAVATVCRLFANFERQGLIVANGKQLNLLDLQRLKKVASGAIELPQ